MGAAHRWSESSAQAESQSETVLGRGTKQRAERVRDRGFYSGCVSGGYSACSLVKVDNVGHDEVHFAPRHFRPVEGRDAERLGVPTPG